MNPRNALGRAAPVATEELNAAWHASTEAYRRVVEEGEPWKAEALAEQWYVLVTCRDERQQAELLGRLQAEGLECKGGVGVVHVAGAWNGEPSPCLVGRQTTPVIMRDG